MTAIWKIFSELPRTFTPRNGTKYHFSGTDFELWLEISLQWNTMSTTGKKPVYLQWLFYMPPKFGELLSRNGWELLGRFAHPLIIFACMLYNRQPANFGTCYVVVWAYSLEQQNAGRAHTRLCHASSWICINFVTFTSANFTSKLKEMSQIDANCRWNTIMQFGKILLYIWVPLFHINTPSHVV